MTFFFGLLWGTAVFGLVLLANQNYEALKAFVDAEPNGRLFVLAGAGFVGISLLIIAVMFLSGVLQALAGRRMPARWLTIFGFVIGLAAATTAVQFIEIQI
jgi:hypothetical protein